MERFFSSGNISVISEEEIQGRGILTMLQARSKPLQYDFRVVIKDCRVEPRRVVHVLNSLIRKGGSRFLLVVPRGGFIDCLDIIRSVHSSFIFISFTVLEDDTSSLGGETIKVEPLVSGEGVEAGRLYNNH